jgi:L-lactate dehydrogenase complex protein LldG
MNNSGREVILGSIRTHLAASVPHDSRELPVHPENPAIMSEAPLASSDLIGLFKRSLEAVDGHCIIVQGKAGIAGALTQIIGALQKTSLRAQRIAISDLPQVEQWMQLTDLEIEELGIAPNASAIFGYDVGITTAQAAIAETGTLVLDSTQERNRLVSLVPPVHIAIVAASTIYETLSEALSLLQKRRELSPAVTFVTGPSRTADIELTLAIGVHGPQELYVIIDGLT